jgi:hypothetical protein
MIEINLVPDIKQELIKAKRVRNLVVSGAIVVGIASVTIVILLAIYLFGVQTLRSSLADGAIKSNESKLQAVPDLANMLTIQSQLANISELHDENSSSSRLFDLLTDINPIAPNQVTFSSVKFDSTAMTVHIDGQAANGFVAADIFKKTIEATKFTYSSGSGETTSPIATDVSISNLSYGEDATGAKVLRFSVDLTYDPNLFLSSSKDVTITPLKSQNATDSFKYLPQTLFGSRANDLGGTQ